MWSFLLVFTLVISSAAFAGETRRSMQVGITITGNDGASAASRKTATGGMVRSRLRPTVRLPASLATSSRRDSERVPLR
jgi:hypothetical protein